MVKFVSDIVGMEVLLFQEHATLGPVTGLVFSPENGDVLGLFCFDPIQKHVRVIVPTEIKRVIGSRIVIEDYDSLADPSDTVRIQAALKVEAKLIKEKGFSTADFDAITEHLACALEELKIDPEIINEVVAISETVRDVLFLPMRGSIK